MQIVIPMAGLWIRFKNKWFSTSKYLLKISWKTIIEKIVWNFDKNNDKFLFICNKIDFEKNKLNEFFEKLDINFKVISIDNHQLWPVYSLYKALNHIDNNENTIVNYCDFYWNWNYSDFKEKIKNYEGGIICYKWFHPHLLRPNLYAWVKTNSKNELIEIKEKFSYTENKMDTWQSSGTYYFKSWEILKKYVNKLINENIKCNWEYYVSLLYNFLYEDNLKTLIYEIKYFLQTWTPEDYLEYKYREEIFNPID